MLKATTAGELHHPPRDGNGESPLATGRSFVEPLVFDGVPENPDEFDVRERIPLEFVEDSPQRAGTRAKKIEELLDEHVTDLERIGDIDAASDSTDEDGGKLALGDTDSGGDSSEDDPGTNDESSDEEDG